MHFHLSSVAKIPTPSHPNPITNCYFPISVPDQNELRLILLVCYTLSTKKSTYGFFTVKMRNCEICLPSDPSTILVPLQYKEHLHHFLWQETLFMEVVSQRTTGRLTLSQKAMSLADHYIMYMDGMLEGLLTTARKRENDPGYRSVTFDTYLVVEYFVGRHDEHNIAGQWRKSHPSTILECQDAFNLGEHCNLMK